MILFFSSDSGYPRVMYDVGKIDSIAIDKNGKDLVIKSKDSLSLIVSILSKSQKLIGIDKPNINRDSYGITFFLNNGKKVLI